jgi:hypothetical protein
MGCTHRWYITPHSGLIIENGFCLILPMIFSNQFIKRPNLTKEDKQYLFLTESLMTIYSSALSVTWTMLF